MEPSYIRELQKIQKYREERAAEEEWKKEMRIEAQRSASARWRAGLPYVPVQNPWKGQAPPCPSGCTDVYLWDALVENWYCPRCKRIFQ